jgi:hypothetical protein
VRAWIADFAEAFAEGALLKIDEIIARGDDFVVSRLRWTGRGSRSGAPLDLAWIDVMWFRDSKMSRGVGYRNRHDALKAVGVWRSRREHLFPLGRGRCAGDVNVRLPDPRPARREPSSKVESRGAGTWFTRMTRACAEHSVWREMRTPIRSEQEAFRFAIAGVLAVGLAVLIGWLIDALVGVAAFAFVLAVALLAYLRAGNPDRREPLRRAASGEHPHGAVPGGRHVLVIANDVLSGEELRTRIIGEACGRVELDVLAPVLASRVHHGVSDIDRELKEARTRLERSLRWAHAQGIAARGEVGDPSATTAIEDELRDFGADEVIVVTHPSEQLTWQEREELERLRGELDVPVVQVAAPRQSYPSAL